MKLYRTLNKTHTVPKSILSFFLENLKVLMDQKNESSDLHSRCFHSMKGNHEVKRVVTKF